MLIPVVQYLAVSVAHTGSNLLRRFHVSIDVAAAQKVVQNTMTLTADCLEDHFPLTVLYKR